MDWLQSSVSKQALFWITDLGKGPRQAAGRPVCLQEGDRGSGSNRLTSRRLQSEASQGCGSGWGSGGSESTRSQRRGGRYRRMRYHMWAENKRTDHEQKTKPASERESRSVVSDSLRLHGLYSLGNSTGRNSGVGSLSLLQGSSQPRNWTQVSHTAGRFFTSWATREAT